MISANNRRKLAALLVAATVAGSFTRGAEPAYASTTDFRPVLTSIMDNGTNTSAPQYINNGFPSEYYNTSYTQQAILQWSLPATEADSAYTLTYPIEEGKYVELTVAKSGTGTMNRPSTIDVSYELNVLSGGAFVPVTYTPGDPGYQVYGDGAVNKWINPGAFPDVNEGPKYENYKVLSTTSPQFRITNNPGFANANGFSFTYDDHTMHFLWDYSKNTFYYATNGIMPGIVYDFTLRQGSSTSTKYVYVADKPSFEPYTTISPGTQGKDATIPLTVKNGIDPDESEIPGASPQNLIAYVNVPKVWDFNGTDRCVLATAAAGALGAISYQVQLMQNNIRMVDFTINDIVAAAPAITSYNYNTDTPPAAPTIQRIGDQIAVTLRDMPDGQIYRGWAVPSSDWYTAGVFTRNALLPFGDAYTLQKYSIVTISNRTYVKMWPYNEPGVYLLAGNEFAPDVDNALHWLVPDYTITKPQGYVLLPVSIGANGMNFRIQFRPTEDSQLRILSQLLHATLEGSGATLEAPTEFEVQESSLTRKDFYFTGMEAELTLKLRWDIGTADTVDKLAVLNGANWIRIDYDLQRAFSPDIAIPFASIGLQLEKPVVGDPISTFSATGATLSSGTIVRSRNIQDGKDHYYAEVELVFDAASKTSAGLPLAGEPFTYPNVYFLNINPVALTTSGGVTESRTPGTSPFDSFTAGTLTRPDVSPPLSPAAGSAATVTNIAGEAVEVSFAYEFTMPSNSLYEFARFHMPELMPSDASLKLNFYISESETAVSALHAMTAQERLAASEVAYASAGATRLYFSAINSAAAMNTGTYTDPREALRDGKLVCVTDIEPDETAVRNLLEAGVGMGVQSFVLDGLDKNMKYYICADIEITQRTSDGAVAVNLPDGEPLIYRTEVSAVSAVTTKGDSETPTVDEKTPVAPKLRIQTIDGVESVSADYATIEWDKVPAAAGERIEYEVLRTYSNPMPDDMLTVREDLGVVWPQLGTLDRRAVLTSGKSVVLLWNGTGYIGLSDNEYEYLNADTESICLYTDNMLMANRIYFYYVRTVKTVNGIRTYSNWSRVTLTTRPVQSPTNLKIEPPVSGTSYRDYDPQTQTMISFSSTVEPQTQLGASYNFYYQTKRDGGEWSAPELMDASTLRSWAAAASGNTYRYIYKLTGFEPGVTYSVRIFARDTDGTDSLYSNIASFRTEIDQGDYDNKEELGIWSEYFKEALLKLLKDPYWTLVNTSSKLNAVYRETMFGTLITEATDASITLYGTAADDAQYYIPISSLIAANAANKGFRIVHENMEIVIPPGMIDTYTNVVIGDMNKAVKAGSTADYYLRLTLTWRYVDRIDAMDTATKQVEIMFETVKSSMTAAKWDSAMLKLIADELAKKAKDTGVIKELEQMIEGGDASEDIIKYIEDEVARSAKEIFETLYTEFRDVIGTAYRLPPDKQYTIIGKDTADIKVGGGYEYLVSAWVARDTVSYTGGKAMYPRAAGTFAFAGLPASIPSLTNVPNAQTITNIIYKYNLEDFFGQMSWATLEQDVNRDMLAGVVARIAGAALGADPIDWLVQNKKLSLSKRNTQAAIQSQEALYLLMSLYEFKTNTKVTSIQIRNYALTNNMQGLESRYKPHVRAAFELGLYTDRSLQPMNALKVKDVLGILANMDKRVRL